MNLTGVLDLKKHTNFKKRNNLVKSRINNKFLNSLNEMNQVSNKLTDYEKRLIILEKKVKKKSIDLGSNIEMKLKSFKRESNEIKNEILNICNNAQYLSELKKKCFFGIKLILENRLIKLKYIYKKLKMKNKKYSKFSKQRKKLLQNRNLQYVFRREDDKNRNIMENNHVNNKNENNNQMDEFISKQNLDQNNKLKKINSTLDKFVSSFKKLSEIVSHHDQMVCDIEYNTVETQDNVRKGKDTLVQIFKDVNSNRKFILKFFFILILIVIFYMIFV